MSDFVWVDVPDDPAQPLGNGVDEPLNFQALADVDRIIVDEGQGDEVCAYRSGAFRGRYAALSTIDPSRNIELMRQGGWPKAPKVIAKTVEPPTPIPTNGQAFGAIYDVDFRTLPNLAIGAAGAYTIAGAEWWAKRDAAVSLQVHSIVNGSGMSWVRNTSGTLSADNGAADYPARAMFLPFASLASYNPNAPVMIRIHTEAPLSGGFVSSIGAALVSSASSGAAWAAAERTFDSAIYADPSAQAGVARTVLLKRGVAGAYINGSPFNGSGVYPTIAQREMMLLRYFGEYSIAGVTSTATWTGTFAAAHLTPYVLDNLAAQVFSTAARANPGVMLFQIASNNTLPTYLTHLQIAQPRVP